MWFFFSSRRRHTRYWRDWSSDVCSSDLGAFYAFPSVASTGLSAHDFATRLLHEARVAVVPGDAFGPGGAGHVRCAYATSLDQIEEALGRIDRFLSDLDLHPADRYLKASENQVTVPTGV